MKVGEELGKGEEQGRIWGGSSGEGSKEEELGKKERNWGSMTGSGGEGDVSGEILE